MLHIHENMRALIVYVQVTVDLDVLVRDELLSYLRADSEARGATILCMYHVALSVVPADLRCSHADATHIFDGLNEFPTHVAHMRLGTFVTPPTAWPIASSGTVTSADRPALYSIALQWLRDDRDHRKELEKISGRKARGSKKEEVGVPTYPITRCAHNKSV